MATTNAMEADVIDRNFDHAAEAVCDHFESILNNNGKHLFITALDLGTKVEGERNVKRGLFDVYLDTFANPADRQHHNCAACRGFINKFGRLATVNADGSIRSVMWDADRAPSGYRDAFAAMAKAVQRGKVTAVFYHDSEMWGDKVTGGTYGFGEPEYEAQP